MRILEKKYILPALFLVASVFLFAPINRARAAERVRCTSFNTGGCTTFFTSAENAWPKCQAFCGADCSDASCCIFELTSEPCPDPPLPPRAQFENYIYWACNPPTHDRECHQDFQALDMNQATDLLSQVFPLPVPCSGGDATPEELAASTQLGMGTCPPVNSTQLATYHCTVVSNNVDTFKQGDCREFTSTNDTDANDEARIKCANNSVDADLVGPALEGTCPAPGSSGAVGCGGNVPGSVEDLQCQADLLNKLGIVEPSQLIGRFIQMLMAFIGSIALALYVYSGFLWMTASGNTEKTGKAKTTMVWTTLGVLMMLASYMLASFLFKSLGL